MLIPRLTAHPFAPVTEIPGILLVRWRLLERTAPDVGRMRYVVGLSPERPDGLTMSAPVTSWDWDLESAVDADGLVYFLGRDNAAGHGDEKLMRAFAAAAAEQGCVDVTDRVAGNHGAWPVRTH